MRGSDVIKTAEIEYPSSDGKPMAETDLHWDWMVTIAQRLKRYFAGRRVYVACNLLIYYQEGDPRKCVAPDAFVVKNCKPGRRETFQIWKERRRPNFVLETTSKTTRREDVGKKKVIYAALGVGEYFLYDPRGDWLKPPLQGFRLLDGAYELIPGDADGGIISQELGIRFVLEHGDLAMFEVSTGQRLPSEKEWAEQETRRADQERRRADEEAAARKALEDELAQLRESSKKANGRRPKNGK
jgi:Uma2 family endonuclease